MLSRDLLEKIHFRLVLIFLITLPFTVVFNSMVVILLGALSLGLFFYYRPTLSFRKDYILLAIGFSLLPLWGLVNSQNLKPVFQDLEQKDGRPTVVS